VETHAATADELHEKLVDGRARAELYRSREALFGWEPTE